MVEGFSIPSALRLFGVGLVATVLLCGLIGAALRFAFGWSFVRSALGLAGFSLPLMSTGIAVGYLSSLSREPAIQDAIPAILTLLGGVLVYVYSLESLRKSVIVGTSVLAFSLNLIVGSAYGSYVRETGKLQRILFVSEQEKRVRNYRASRNLPEEIPDWITE